MKIVWVSFILLKTVIYFNKINENESDKKMYYYTYMIRCEDNSIYTGMTNNLEKKNKRTYLKRKKMEQSTPSRTMLLN